MDMRIVTSPKSRFWVFEQFNRSKYFTLLAVLLGMPLAQALVDGYPVLEMGYWIAFVGMIVCALVAIDRKRQAFWIGLFLGMPALVATMALPMTGFNVDHQLVVLVLARTVVFLSLLSLLIIEILRDVLHTQRVMFEQVCGGLCIYLMIGIAWGLAYSALERIEPGAFLIDWTRYGLDHDGSPARLNALMTYFSFICLTTLGFGDVSPVSPVARGLVCVEAVLSQIYLAVFVARLVSQYLASGLMTITVENPSDLPDRKDDRGAAAVVDASHHATHRPNVRPHARSEHRRTGREASGNMPEKLH
jgi:hypothetical protein